MSPKQSRVTDLRRTSQVIFLSPKHFCFHTEQDKTTVTPQSGAGPRIGIRLLGSESDSQDPREATWGSASSGMNVLQSPAEEPHYWFFSGFCVPGARLDVPRLVQEDGRLSLRWKSSHLGGHRTPAGGQIRIALVLQPLLCSDSPPSRGGAASVRHNLTQFLPERAKNWQTEYLDNSYYPRLFLDLYFCMCP